MVGYLKMAALGEKECSENKFRHFFKIEDGALGEKKAIVIRNYIRCCFNDGGTVSVGEVTNLQRILKEISSRPAHPRTNVSVINELLQTVYGEEAMSRLMIGRWCCMFSEGRQTEEDGRNGDRFNSCQVIYSQFGLAIHQNDHQARRRFVEWAQNEIAVVPDFHKRILFSDEAHFWLNGYVSKQNCRIWSEANPQVYVETPLTSRKLTVWCALWAGEIIGPYFFKNDEGHNVTVNGDRYRAMITNFFIPELNNHDVQELWFQQDDATCHTARATIHLLKNTFGERLISRFGPVNWPARSCDLTPLDYFLWGYVKLLVYADKPQTLDHSEDNIRRAIADIRPQMLEKVIENWTTLSYMASLAVLCQKSYLSVMPQDYLSNKKNPCQSNNTSLFYCNLKLYTSKKHPLELKSLLRKDSSVY
ncbi:transposable element Tc3 transposase [Trichonephila clavipes]|nr:transposable element Tc3 transposase [Trichonephila clavipes]